MKREVKIKSKPQIWLEVSIDLLHIVAWLGIYYFLKTLLPAGRAVTYAGILVGVCIVLECLLRAVGRFFSGVYRIQWIVFAEAVILFFYGGFQEETFLRIYGIILAGLCIAGHFWCLFLQGMTEYLEQNGELKNVPEESIFRGNTRVVSIMVLAVSFVFLMIVLVRQDISISFVGDFFKMLIVYMTGAVRWIVRLLERFSGKKELTPGSTSLPSATRTPKVIDDDHGQGLAGILLLAVIGAVIIYIFVKMILTSQEPTDPPQGERPVFHKKGTKEDVVERLDTEEKGFLFFRNPRERVRYLFKKQVKSYYRKKVPSSRTAGELCRDMQQEMGGKGPDPRRDVYEKARYSRRPITRQDVKKMKKNE